MCEALMELMRDEFEEAVEKRATKAEREAAERATRAEREAAERAELAERAAEREVANRSAEAVRVLMDRFGLGRDEAMDAMKIPAESRASVIALL